MTGFLSGQGCVVMGAASRRGLGHATSRPFVEHGVRIVVLDLDAGAVPTLHERFEISTTARSSQVRGWLS